MIRLFEDLKNLVSSEADRIGGKLDDFITNNDNKASALIEIKNKMISIEVLSNMECDYMVIEINSEKLLHYENHIHSNFYEISESIQKFLNTVKEL